MPHDADLVVESLLRERVEQEAHAIALEPQRELELVRRHRLEVVRAIEIGRAVHRRGARALEELEVRVLGDVPRALEHHVLEQVREPGAAGDLVAGADVVPRVDGDERDVVIDREDHLETVVERVALEVDLRA